MSTNLLRNAEHQRHEQPHACSMGRRQTFTLLHLHGQGVTGSLYVANKGAIRFYQKSADTCSIKLTISYEVPGILGYVAGALTPLVESILATDLRRFAKLASEQAQAQSAIS